MARTATESKATKSPRKMPGAEPRYDVKTVRALFSNFTSQELRGIVGILNGIVTKKLKVKPGKSKSVRLKLGSLPAELLGGSYHVLVRVSAAQVVSETGLTAAELANRLATLFGNGNGRGRLLAMAEAARALAVTNAAERAAELCLLAEEARA